MKRHVRLLVQYFAQYAKVRLAYKADFIIAFFSSMAATVLGFGFVLVLFTKIPSLQGWSFNEVMFLYGFSLIPLGFFNVISWNLYDFSEIYIVEGKFDRVLLRPVSTLFQVVFEKFRLESLQEVVTGLIVVSLCIHRLHLAMRVPDYLWFALMIVCGSAEQGCAGDGCAGSEKFSAIYDAPAGIQTPYTPIDSLTWADYARRPSDAAG